MKTAQTLPHLLTCGFASLLTALSLAQSSNTSRTTVQSEDVVKFKRQLEERRRDDLALEKLLLLESRLKETGQTNILKLVNDYQSANLVMSNSRDIEVMLRVLGDLRAGRTNEAIVEIEQELTTDVAILGIGYRRLEPLFRQRLDLTALKAARDYCKKYFVKRKPTDYHELTRRAFELLDEKPSQE